jgi:serine/threonine-protein kinase
MTLAAGTPIGKYVVRRKLAEGGMAELYLAAALGPEGFEKDVVIKRVRPGLADDPGFVRMFIAEARVASRLNHANLVHIFDFDKHQDTYYLAMEYVRGHSLWELRRRCQERGVPVPPTLAAQIGMELARGLAYAHRLTEAGKPLRLVHRDVTPHNVLLSFDGAVKLTDFGIAKAGGRSTASGVLKGKFAYMSPEQARGDAVDARTDTFALGVTLWELLTGSRLFEGDGDAAVLRAVQERVIVPPARLNPDVPAALDAAVMRALERDPARRWPSAQDLERALAEFLLGGARALEDTDVGAFLRRLFPEESGVAEPAEGSRSIPISLSSSGSPAARGPTAHGAVTELEEVEPPAPSTAVLSRPVHATPERGRRLVLRAAAGVGAVLLAAAVGLVLPRLSAWRQSLGGGTRSHAPEALSGPSPAVGEGTALASAAPASPAETLSGPAGPLTTPPKVETDVALQRPPPEPTAGARQPRALLTVRAKPWVQVWVDRHDLGSVQPSKTFRLRPGWHRVELIGSDGAPRVQRLYLRAGDTTVLEHPPNPE